jgi:hypothetical protein
MTLTIIFGIVAGGTAAACAYERATKENLRFTVQDKGIQITGGDGNVSSEYLIHTEGETLQNTTSVFNGKFKNAELQGQLEVGKTYDAVVYGKRIPILGMFRNIISVQEIQDGQKNSPVQPI